MERMFKKLGQILTGYYLLIFFKKSDISKARQTICSKCPKRKLLVCGECGCVISAKVTLIEEECPLGKW